MSRRSTSATTWLAAAASGALACAAALAPGGGGAGRWVLVAGSLFAASAGVGQRVTAVEVTREGLVIARASGTGQRAEWAGIRELRPPRWPLGRWQVRSGTEAISLMPSDLLGGEDALTEIVRRSDLGFRRGRWRRPGGVDPGGGGPGGQPPA